MKPSEIATEADELHQANDDVQRTFRSVINPFLREDWQKQYEVEVKGVSLGPQYKAP